MMVHMVVGACLLFIVTVSGALTNDEPFYTCTDQELDGCMLPLLREYVNGQKDIAMFFIAGGHLDEEALNSFCSDIQHVKGCVNDVLKSCDDSTKKRFRGFFNVYEYVCGQGKQVYLSEQQCLSQPELTKPELANDLASCTKRANDRIRRATQKLHNSPSRAEAEEARMEFCSSTHVFDHCMRSSVGKHCSEEAWNFTLGVFDAALEPLVSDLHCDDTSPPNIVMPKYPSTSSSGLSSKDIARYACLGVAVLVGILLAVVGVVVRSRRKRILLIYSRSVLSDADRARLM